MTDNTSTPGEPRALRVLVVEDDLDNAALLRMLLVRRGFAVTLATTVGAALAAAAAEPMDIVISDLRLPDGRGEDLVRQLHAGPRRVPAIALTGRVDPESVESARAAGFDEHLGKPISIDRLVAALRRIAQRGDG